MVNREVLNQISKNKIVPVVTFNSLDEVEPICQCILDGGLNVIEVTMRNSLAINAFEIIKSIYPEMIIGAGTVCNEQQCQDVIDKNVDFIVSPGLSEAVINCSKTAGIPVIPGCSTPTEIIKAMDLDIEIVKFFPAELSGGVDAVKTMSNVFRDLKFLPTGGINNKNYMSYLNLPSVFAVGGSWMIDKELIKRKDFDKVKENIRLCIKELEAAR